MFLNTHKGKHHTNAAHVI